MPRIPIGDYFETLVDYLTVAWKTFFEGLGGFIEVIIDNLESSIAFVPFWVFAIVIAVIAYKRTGKGIAIFSLVGILFIDSLELWPATISTLSLIFTATLMALVLGIPLGILSSP
jgi:glycine betaine/proline transport system permease protein